ncbi:hypothetical protein SO802_012306 [Lithocarpus litseifolius]|uniref:Uncharacterized protein n=1 Tax=Lithocarpus litseifolius TaxID=425828 RepID=A0AAW2D5X3_9ROSI
MPFEGDFPLIGNIVLESSPPPSAHIRSNRRPTADKSRPAASRPSADALPSSRTRSSKRKTSPPPASTTTKRRSKHKEDMSATRPILLNEPDFEAKPKPISIYHPTAEEISAAMGTPMEGFFDGADVVAEAIATASPAAVQEAPAETSIPSAKLVPVDNDTHTERVSVSSPIPVETPTPQKEPASRLPLLPPLLSSLQAILSQLYLRL